MEDNRFNINNITNITDPSNYIYLAHIHSLLNPYKNMKLHRNKLNKIYKPSNLSKSYSCKDIYNMNVEENKMYFLIYYDDSYEKNFL